MDSSLKIINFQIYINSLPPPAMINRLEKEKMEDAKQKGQLRCIQCSRRFPKTWITRGEGAKAITEKAGICSATCERIQNPPTTDLELWREKNIELTVIAESMPKTLTQGKLDL